MLLYILSADDSGRVLQNPREVAQNRRRTKCTEHARQKIRPSKGLELYIFQIICALLRAFACFCVRPRLERLRLGTAECSVLLALLQKLVGDFFC